MDIFGRLARDRWSRVGRMRGWRPTTLGRVSNPDRAPAEVTCDGREGAGRKDPVVLPSREVPLGGPRAMLVRRSLPQRERSLIGA